MKRKSPSFIPSGFPPRGKPCYQFPMCSPGGSICTHRRGSCIITHIGARPVFGIVVVTYFVLYFFMSQNIGILFILFHGVRVFRPLDIG